MVRQSYTAMFEACDLGKLFSAQYLSREAKSLLLRFGGEGGRQAGMRGLLQVAAFKNGSLTPSLFPQFLRQSCHVTQHWTRKKSREREQHGAVLLAGQRHLFRPRFDFFAPLFGFFPPRCFAGGPEPRCFCSAG